MQLTACLDQHLQLVRSLRDRSAESLACHYLGVLSNAQGEYAQQRYFTEAKRLAKDSGETGIMKVAACNIGMANANMKLNAHIKGGYRNCNKSKKVKKRKRGGGAYIFSHINMMVKNIL